MGSWSRHFVIGIRRISLSIIRFHVLGHTGMYVSNMQYICFLLKGKSPSHHLRRLELLLIPLTFCLQQEASARICKSTTIPADSASLSSRPFTLYINNIIAGIHLHLLLLPPIDNKHKSIFLRLHRLVQE